MRVLYERFGRREGVAPATPVHIAGKEANPDVALLDRYARGDMDKGLLERARQVLGSDKRRPRDEWYEKERDYVMQFCFGGMTGNSLRVALDAIDRRRQALAKRGRESEALK